VNFVLLEVTDSHLQQVDLCTRRVTNLLIPWKNAAQVAKVCVLHMIVLC
jgi:hypothetical protein